MHTSDIIKAMELSAVAYHNVQPTFPTETLIMIDDPKTDVQCYLRKRCGCLSITFRGSTTCRDWRTNLALRRKVVPYENNRSKIKVHSGFLKAYKSPAVRNTIQSIVSEDIYQVKIFGHSQGAALAILCGVDLEYNFPDKDYEVVLLGAPRIGNKAFKESYDKRIFKTLRIENGNDNITKLPFACMGYRHVGMAIHIGNPKLPWVFSRKAHSLQSYYKNFLKLIRWNF